MSLIAQPTGSQLAQKEVSPQPGDNFPGEVTTQRQEDGEISPPRGNFAIKRNSKLRIPQETRFHLDIRLQTNADRIRRYY
jgi:hypothetical protein